MKKIIVISLIFLIIGFAVGWFIFGNNTKNSNSENTTQQTPAKKIAYYQDPMHPWYTSDKPGKAPDCGMDLVPVYEGEENINGIKIDPTVIQNIGVTTEEVKKRTLTKEIRTVGKIDYNETRLYSVNTKYMGWVEKLYVNYTGKYVSKGEKLLEVYSPDLVSTQEEYLQAVKYRKSLENSSEDIKKGAEDLIQSAKRRLLYWDISEIEIDNLENKGIPKKTLPIYSPANGIVTDKMIVEGDNIMTGMNLFKIADLSSVWVIAEIYQFELPWVKVGQTADIELSYLPGRSYKGKINYIYPYLGMETKTIKVRVELRNTSNYDLKPGMFATVIIKSPIKIESIAVPDQAIIRSGERDIVIISLGNGYFEPREVKLGVAANNYVQILEGLHEGEQVVTSSQFLIDSESNLRTAINQMSNHSQHNMSSESNSQMDTKSNQNEQEKNNKNANQMNNLDNSKMNDNDMQQMNQEGKSKEASPLIRTGIIDLKAIDKNKDGKVYQDMMDWNVISDETGTCPICGMKLKEVTLDEAKKNLEEHGFKVK
ncbi:MAG: efflux RND transporter periplasmic adaptor subunit [Chloroherpetonaceae bacterium]